METDNTAPEVAVADATLEKLPLAPVPSAPAPASKTAAPPPVVVADPVAFAVMTAPRGGLVSGQVVFAAGSEIAALIAAGDARAPTTGELDRAHPFHYALPPAAAPASEA